MPVYQTGNLIVQARLSAGTAGSGDSELPLSFDWTLPFYIGFILCGRLSLTKMTGRMKTVMLKCLLHGKRGDDIEFVISCPLSETSFEVQGDLKKLSETRHTFFVQFIEALEGKPGFLLL